MKKKDKKVNDAKMSSTRDFLNDDLSMPGCIIVDSDYRGVNEERLDSITIKIADCNRTVSLDFDCGYYSDGLTQKLKIIDNSIRKVELIMSRIAPAAKALKKEKARLIKEEKAKPKKKQ